MKTFNQFLTEGRDAPLYHATGLHSFFNILASDELQVGAPQPQFPEKGRAISLTRDLKFALQWITHGIIFELDQAKLARKYRIEPYNFFDDVSRRLPTGGHQWANQSEESIFKNIDNLNRYVVKIIFNLSTIEYLNAPRNQPLLPLLKGYTDRLYVADNGKLIKVTCK